MRIESHNPSGDYVSIYDLGAGKRFRLDEKNKQVSVVDLRSETARTTGLFVPEKLRTIIRATGKHFEVAGFACDEYTFDLQVPTRPTHGGLGTIQHEQATVCVSQTIPGGDEMASYIHEAQKRGYVIAAADLCPTFSPFGIYFYENQPNVMVLSTKAESGSRIPPQFGPGEFGQVKIQRTVLSISTDPIPDENFQVPVGWKMKDEPTAK